MFVQWPWGLVNHGSHPLLRLLAALEQHGSRALLVLYPYIHALTEAIKFCYQLNYLLDVFDCHSPVLHVLGQRLVRLSGPELVSGHCCVLSACWCHLWPLMFGHCLPAPHSREACFWLWMRLAGAKSGCYTTCAAILRTG